MEKAFLQKMEKNAVRAPQDFAQILKILWNPKEVLEPIPQLKSLKVNKRILR